MPACFRSLIVAAFVLIAHFVAGSCTLVADDKPLPHLPTRAFVHSLFQNNMLLQREKPIPVWGWTKPGSDVTVEFAGQKKRGVAAVDGKWLVHLDPLAASGEGRTLSITSSTDNRQFSNVLVGDVWVCSGQSNMQGNLERTGDAATLANADVPTIRFFSAIPSNDDNGTETPIDDFGKTRGEWRVCSPQSADKLSRTAYYFGRELHDRQRVPIGLIVVALNASPIESWTSREALMSLPPYEVDGRFYSADDAFNEIIPHWHLPCVRYNSLIHPLAPFAIKGFLWYQGETNAAWRHPGNRYAELLSLMIRSWRACWDGEELPFITVQLPSTPRDKVLKDPPRRNPWAEVQHCQSLSLALPKTGVAICMDLGDGDLHPKTKDKIGARAALAARMIAYEEPIVGMGPVFKELKIEGKSIRLSFDHIGGGLTTNDGEAPRFFAIAGDDQKFVWADAALDGNEIVVSSKSVERPIAVRYGWVTTGAVNLVNREGLPASPFRIDLWDEAEEKTPRLRGVAGNGLPWNGKATHWPLAPFALAAQQGNLTTMQTMLADTPNAIQQFNAAGYNLLNAPIVEGRSEVVVFLLANGADPRLPELSGLYPIHRAAQFGRTQIVEMLLDAGIKPQIETRNPGRATPLFFAAQSDHSDVVKLLLDRGADIETGRQFYRAGSGIEPHPPLWAAFEKSKSGATAKWLIERGAKIDQLLPMQDFPLHLAARKNLPGVIELLIAKGVDLNQQSGRKTTALQVAAEAGAKDAVELLLQKGAVVTPEALAAAKKKGDSLILRLLEKPGM